MELAVKQVLEYTWKTINPALDTMRAMFDLVRLVDAEECREISVSEEGKLQFGKACYAVWDADHRCANCTSYQACHTHQRKDRIEFFHGKKYQIQSVPVRIALSDDSVYSCNMELINVYHASEGETASSVEKDERETTGYLSTHDKLTGVLNWDGFCRAVRSRFSENGKEEQYFILSINIQNFKLVNSLFGRNKGDEILISIAEILGTLFEGENITARVGSDNFAVCLGKEKDLEGKLAEAVERPGH